jgi:hypothetical protein
MSQNQASRDQFKAATTIGNFNKSKLIRRETKSGGMKSETVRAFLTRRNWSGRRESNPRYHRRGFVWLGMAYFIGQFN